MIKEDNDKKEEKEESDKEVMKLPQESPIN